MLDLEHIEFIGRVGAEHATTLAELDAIAFPHLVLPVVEVSLTDTHKHLDNISMWAPVLRFFDPAFLTFVPLDDPALRVPLTPNYVRYESVAPLLASWSRLEGVACTGPNSIPVFDHNADGEAVYKFAFDEHLQRCAIEQSSLVQYHLMIFDEEHEQIVWEEDLPQDLVKDGALRIGFHSPCGPGEQYLFRASI